MQTEICKRLGCEVPIFAFSHSKEVVVEVTKAGGFGCFGALTHSPEELEEELSWIDAQLGGRPYGVDIIIPKSFDEKAAAAKGPLRSLVPAELRAFVDRLLDEAGIPDLPAEEEERIYSQFAQRERNYTPQGAQKLIDVTLQHKGVKLIVSALGAPPREMVDDFHARGILVGGMCGHVSHAKYHLQAGADLLIAQGSEAGGHTGTITTLVLVPDVIAAAGTVPVLAAGGIGKGDQIAAAVAMGAQGVWCGTIWLGAKESELSPLERSVLLRSKAEDAVISRWMSGKPLRMIRSRSTDAWEKPGAPQPLQPPLQSILYHVARARIERAGRADFCSFPAGQLAGTINEETTVAEIMEDMKRGYRQALERLRHLLPEYEAGI